MSATKAYHHDTIEAGARQAIKERPILFSGPMVRAILAGRKTQTRRIIKPQPSQKENGWWKWDGTRPKATRATGSIASNTSPEIWLPFSCPYRYPGDRLWVRETWAKQLSGKYIYRADHQDWELADYTATGAWRPSIYMPRAACRILLQITHIRVERLHDISADDARAEGCTDPGPIAIGEYQTLWEKINGPESWALNPWVWVITFKPV